MLKSGNSGDMSISVVHRGISSANAAFSSVAINVILVVVCQRVYSRFRDLFNLNSVSEITQVYGLTGIMAFKI